MALNHLLLRVGIKAALKIPENLVDSAESIYTGSENHNLGKLRCFDNFSRLIVVRTHQHLIDGQELDTSLC